MFRLYNLALLPFYPLLGAYTLWRRFVQKKSAASVAGLWGAVPREAITPPDTSTPVIWIHAVSVGETIAARPIARALKRLLPTCRVVLSNTTDTGHQTAQAALKSGDVDATIFFPLDLPYPVARALNAIRPDVFLSVETELWPNLLHLARRRGVLCLLANGRVSDSLLQSAPRLKPLWRWMFSNLDALLMRSEFDAQRMTEIGKAVGARDTAGKVLVSGDVKLDEVSSREEQSTLRAKWRAALKIRDDELLWVCGSTHPAIKETEVGEEQISLDVFNQLKLESQNQLPLRLLIAPRHIERSDKVWELCRVLCGPVVSRSEIDNSDGDEIIVLDTIGELSEIYAAADIAFVGGSLVSRGGHNVLEPVLRGAAVLFGPHVQNFRAAAAFVEAEKLGEQVNDAEHLKERVEYWLKHADVRAQIPERAMEALAPHQGAAERIAQEVAERLKSKVASKH